MKRSTQQWVVGGTIGAIALALGYSVLRKHHVFDSLASQGLALPSGGHDEHERHGKHKGHGKHKEHDGHDEHEHERGEYGGKHKGHKRHEEDRDEH